MKDVVGAWHILIKKSDLLPQGRQALCRRSVFPDLKKLEKNFFLT